MAKQLGVIQFRGSLGETVGSKKAVGQKNNTMRVRVREIANPKTQAQAMQRMRMTPAVNIYRALSEILDHSFQGIPYGSPSHSYFMKHALKGDQFPYVEKGDTRPIPGAYLISSGSIPRIVPNFIGVAGATHVGIGMVTDKADNETFTMAELTQAAIEQLGLASGDQLTFVNCLADDGIFEANIRWDIRRIILKASDENPAPSWIVAKDGQITISIKTIAADYYSAASAIIVSRPRIRKGKVTWLRSTAYIVVDGTILRDTRSSSRFETCLETYMTAQAANLDSDYYLNQGTADEGDNSGSISGGRMLVAGAFNGNSNALFMTTNGTPRLVVKEDPSDNKRKFYYTYNAGENVATMVRPSLAATALPSQYVLMSTVQNYFPNLEVNENGAIEEES
ncbi:MAG: hypothetical protein UH685_03155 [Bacteroidaceae bacterium]|nr:hypothetical protein [Bacteroidaceae bacterium]